MAPLGAVATFLLLAELRAYSTPQVGEILPAHPRGVAHLRARAREAASRVSYRRSPVPRVSRYNFSKPLPGVLDSWPHGSKNNWKPQARPFELAWAMCDSFGDECKGVTCDSLGESCTPRAGELRNSSDGEISYLREGMLLAPTPATTAQPGSTWKHTRSWPEARPLTFVAVFSRRTDASRRGLVRNMWRSADWGSGNVTARFVLCDKPDSATAEKSNTSHSLGEEERRFGDVLILDCQEGYGHGLLTRKVLAAMQHFVHQRDSSRTLFMKVDDDAFVGWHALGDFLARMGSPFSYMGVPAVPSAPIRDPHHKWQEPSEVFPEEVYPWSMLGGPGYILGGELVSRLLADAQDEPLLWNEDRALGVWVQKMVERGERVDIADIPGVDENWGCFEQHERLRWGEYSQAILLHHQLSGETIACLSLADVVNDPNRRIDSCFVDC